MQRGNWNIIATLSIVGLVSLAGCAGFGGGNSGITIAKESVSDGSNIYIESNDGLPAGTEITTEVNLETDRGDANTSETSTLNRSVEPGERVYIGSGEAYIIGMPPESPALNRTKINNAPTGKWKMTVTITVDTGSVTSEKMFVFEGDNVQVVTEDE